MATREYTTREQANAGEIPVTEYPVSRVDRGPVGPVLAIGVADSLPGRLLP